MPGCLFFFSGIRRKFRKTGPGSVRFQKMKKNRLENMPEICKTAAAHAGKYRELFIYDQQRLWGQTFFPQRTQKKDTKEILQYREAVSQNS